MTKRRLPLLAALGILALAALLAGCGGHKRARPVQKPASGRISWAEAQRLLRACRIVALGQTHSRLVTLTLRTGVDVHTRERRIDDIFRTLNRLPQNCRPRTVATE